MSPQTIKRRLPGDATVTAYAFVAANSQVEEGLYTRISNILTSREVSVDPLRVARDTGVAIKILNTIWPIAIMPITDPYKRVRHRLRWDPSLPSQEKLLNQTSIDPDIREEKDEDNTVPFSTAVKAVDPAPVLNMAAPDPSCYPSPYVHGSEPVDRQLPWNPSPPA